MKKQINLLSVLLVVLMGSLTFNSCKNNSSEELGEFKVKTDIIGYPKDWIRSYPDQVRVRCSNFVDRDVVMSYSERHAPINAKVADASRFTWIKFLNYRMETPRLAKLTIYSEKNFKGKSVNISLGKDRTGKDRTTKKGVNGVYDFDEFEYSCIDDDCISKIVYATQLTLNDKSLGKRGIKIGSLKLTY